MSNGTEDPGLWAKIAAGFGAALAALGTWAWAHTHTRIDRKADAQTFMDLKNRVETHMVGKAVFEEHLRSDERQLEAINNEMSNQRGNIGKLFDKVEEVRKDMHEGQERLLTAINNIDRRRR